MKRKRFAVIAVLSLVMMLMTSVSYGETIPEREADVSSVSEGYILAGFDGTYYHTSKDQILERINAIRKEAYDEGLVSKYVPIKWSSDLEYIAQIRAAEGAVLRSHTRPNGENCFSVTHNGQQSWAEDLAWNYTGLMDGIEQWYNEKADYLKDPNSKDAGHYRSLITVNYKYIGLGCFRLDAGGMTTTAGELSDEDNLDETESSLSGHYRQLMQVQTSDLQDLTIAGDAKMKDGDTSAYTCKASFKYNSRTLQSDVTNKVDWSSSNPSVATIDSNGNVAAKSLGTTTIQAILKDGAGNTVKTATQELKVARPQVLSISFENTTVQKTCADETYFTQKPTIETQDDPEYTVSWKSSDQDVAIVSSTGEVTVKNTGETTITATISKNLSASYKLIVSHGDMETVPKKAATFDADGHNEYQQCSLCEKEFGKSVIPKMTAKLSTTAYTYTGGTKTPSVICSGASGLTKDRDYTVSLPAGRKAVGKYTITVKGAGDKYTGSKTLTYVINPKGAGIKKPAAAKKAFTAKWSKQSAKMNKARITGYQVQYSLKSNFKSAKTVTVKGYTKTSKKISKLKAKKTYYVRVRTYMKSGKTTFYSTWSGRKSVKTK